MTLKTRAEVLLLGLLLLLPACAERPAVEAEVAGVEAAYGAIRVEAAIVAPDQAISIELAIARARERLEAGDFRESSAMARDLLPRVKELADRLPGMRVELGSTWKRLRTSLPGRIASLGQDLRSRKRPPVGRRRAVFDAAKKDLNALEDQWQQEAQSAMEDGRLVKP